VRIAYHVPRASFLGPGHSGDQILVSALANGLRAHGHDLRLVTWLDARELGRGRVPARRALAEAVRVRRRMRRFAPDAWLVYMPSVTYPDLFGWWQRPRRYVLFAADAGRPERLPRARRPLFGLAHNRSLKTADRVTVYRPRGAERLRALGVDPDRIDVLPPAVALPESPLSQEESRRALGLPEQAPVVVCVSRFTGSKGDGRPGKTAGVVELLRAIASLPPRVLCVVVGDGRGRREIELERERLGLDDRVRLVGAVPNDEVPVYFAAADVSAYPYGLDRPWMAALEAQGCGVPVVTMRTASAELTIEDGSTGLLAEHPEEFRAQLAALVGDRTRCRKMGEAARDYVAARHSLDVRVRELEHLLAA
jgi:glycosyltransferase involved in cell wall biosynthesis